MFEGIKEEEKEQSKNENEASNKKSDGHISVDVDLEQINIDWIYFNNQLRYYFH